MSASDVLVCLLCVKLPADLGWQLRGWHAHVKQLDTAAQVLSAYADNRQAFGRIEREYELITAARVFDFGMSVTYACSEMMRYSARVTKEG